MMAEQNDALTWEELASSATWNPDFANGPNNSFSRLRLFGETAADVRVTLYRDTHAWCPYCQKVWIFLEENKIPYRVQKVNMNFFGEKQAWYKEKVPSGKVPAIEIHGKPGQKFPWMSSGGQDQIISESDEIIAVLEKTFKPLPTGSISDIVTLRNLERKLFTAWCNWLCKPSSGSYNSNACSSEETDFRKLLSTVAAVLEATPGDYFLEDFSVADIIFAPFLERMLASLFYFKGFDMKKEEPAIERWFKAMETRESYRGTQSDFTTHVNVLPPSMGGCFEEQNQRQVTYAKFVRTQNFRFLPECSQPEPTTSVAEALSRTLRCKDAMLARMEKDQKYLCPDKSALDLALRCAMTAMTTGEAIRPPPGTDVGLRWIKSRTCCPRDMSVWAGRRYRMALEATATLAGNAQPKPVPTDNRYDQDPVYFSILAWDLSQAFRGPQDFRGPAPAEIKRSDSDRVSDASTGSGSVGSRASKDSEFSGWDEEVLKKNTAGTKIGENNVPKPSKGKKSFFGFTPPWRSCACN
jgi:glutathione S-transferase